MPSAAASTFADTDEKARERRIAEAKEHPMVKAVLAAFPEAEVTDVRARSAPTVEALIEEEP